jgi:hypothetical protein
MGIYLFNSIRPKPLPATIDVYLHSEMIQSTD